MCLGHESAGIIVSRGKRILECSAGALTHLLPLQTAIGEGVTDYKVGERVAIEAGVYCGACRLCKTGRYNLCTKSELPPAFPFLSRFADLSTTNSALQFFGQGLPSPGRLPPILPQPPRHPPSQAPRLLLLRSRGARRASLGRPARCSSCPYRCWTDGSCPRRWSRRSARSCCRKGPRSDSHCRRRHVSRSIHLYPRAFADPTLLTATKSVSSLPSTRALPPRATFFLALPVPRPRRPDSKRPRPLLRTS